MEKEETITRCRIACCSCQQRNEKNFKIIDASLFEERSNVLIEVGTFNPTSYPIDRRFLFSNGFFILIIADKIDRNKNWNRSLLLSSKRRQQLTCDAVWKRYITLRRFAKKIGGNDDKRRTKGTSRDYR